MVLCSISTVPWLQWELNKKMNKVDWEERKFVVAVGSTAVSRQWCSTTIELQVKQQLELNYLIDNCDAQRKRVKNLRAAMRLPRDWAVYGQGPRW
jgi:hypothetical protein